MADEALPDDDRALYLKWRDARPAPVVLPDAMSLAAYAEARLDEADAAEIETALAADPDLIGHVLAARHAGEPAIVPASFLLRAKALAPTVEAEIIPFRRPAPRRRAGGMVTWGALAASLLIVSAAGFSLGVEAQETIDNGSTASAPTPIDLIGQSESGIG